MRKYWAMWISVLTAALLAPALAAAGGAEAIQRESQRAERQAEIGCVVIIAAIVIVLAAIYWARRRRPQAKATAARAETPDPPQQGKSE